MSRFGGNRETLRREDERKFARLLGNAKVQLVEHWNRLLMIGLVVNAHLLGYLKMTFVRPVIHKVNKIN